MKTYKYALEATVFMCGAVVMIFELVGSRVLGPYFGTSIFVWTSLIGIILGSLSFGYYLGGKISDKAATYNALSVIIFLAAIFIGITNLIKNALLVALLNYFSNIEVSLILGSLILFLPASVLLGIVSPYAAKLRLDNLKKSGSTIGNLYAISTLGSIFGTFFSGFYLIPHFGTNKLLIILSVILIVISLALSLKDMLGVKLFSLAVVIFALIAVSSFVNVNNGNNFVDIDTEYNRIWIYDRLDLNTNKLTKVMAINNENHSSMFLDSNELVNEYTRYYHLASHFNPDFKKTLMLGGAGYSYPKDFLQKYPEATMDVIEIDPKVTALAKKYFKLNDNLRLKIYHKDGRVYLNKTQEKYDVIFGDAFSSRYSLPYQLTTQEVVKRKFDILNNDGVVILNIISSMEGERGKFLRAEYSTYKSVFPQVYLFPVKNVDDGGKVQNIIMIALKSRQEQIFNSIDPQIDDYLKHLWKKEVDTDMPILTDDYAPVDSYINNII